MKPEFTYIKNLLVLFAALSLLAEPLIQWQYSGHSALVWNCEESRSSEAELKLKEKKYEPETITCAQGHLSISRTQASNEANARLLLSSDKFHHLPEIPPEV